MDYSCLCTGGSNACRIVAGKQLICKCFGGDNRGGKEIWEFLMEQIGNSFGVAGLMGNLYAESGMRPNNLQNSYEKKLGMSDASYTAAVDNGNYSSFVRDSAGYGLAQ